MYLGLSNLGLHPNAGGPALNLDFISTEIPDSRLTTSGGVNGTRVNSNGLLVAASAPRYDYDPVTLAANGLLIEEQRTNVYLQSRDISNAAWLKVRASTPGTTTTAPDGGVAYKVVEDTSASTSHLWRQDFAATAGQAYSVTLYVKPAERTQFQLAFDSDASTAYAPTAQAIMFTLTGSGSMAVASGTPTGSIQLVGGGWYKCTATATAAATAQAIMRFYLAVSSSIGYTGDGSSGLFAWHGQAEAGVFATSPIFTAASQVTRTADSITMTGSNLSSWYNSATGTFLVQGTPNTPITQPNNQGLISVDDGTLNNRIFLYRSSVSGVYAELFTSSGTPLWNISGAAWAQGTSSKQALAYASGDRAWDIDGGAVSTDATAGSVTGLTTMHIGSRADGALPWNGWVKAIRFYSSRLPNATLQTLTS